MIMIAASWLQFDYQLEEVIIIMDKVMRQLWTGRRPRQRTHKSKILAAIDHIIEPIALQTIDLMFFS